MNNVMKLAMVSTLALTVGTGAAVAQASLVGTQALDDRIESIEDAVKDDFARAEDASRFGNPEFRPGLSGSASLSYSGKTGNSESQEFSAGARLRFAQGQWVHTLGAALDFADTAGVKTKEDIFMVYDGNYYFDKSFYGFVLARVQTDGLATAATDVRRDGFLGFGPGYRVVNTEQMTWRVQAGIGVNYLQDGVGASTTETGYIASSRFFYAFNENVFLTNDTDILKSKGALRVNNDIGVNLKMTDAFSTRVSYLTEYNDNRAIRSDNKVGVSLVYGF